MQHFLLLGQKFSLENIAFFIQKNLHKIVAIVIFLIGVMFGTVYKIEEHRRNHQKIVSSYIAGVNYLAQKDLVLALRHFQTVYNKAEGRLEMLALMNIIDILIEDKQYTQLVDILADAPSSTHSPEDTILLYSKIINTIYILQRLNIEGRKLLPIAEGMQKTLENTTINSELLAHKNILLIELNGITKTRPQSYYTAKTEGGSSGSALKNVVMEIGNNYQ